MYNMWVTLKFQIPDDDNYTIDGLVHDVEYALARNAMFLYKLEYEIEEADDDSDDE